MTPLLSVLTPAYNAESWVANTIRSALAQTWMNKEIIFIDDGSSDRTLSIAHQFASKTVSVVSQENQGAAATETKRSPFARDGC
jgi:glycosyltransferase involved in cell wall biosynthesis